MIHHPCRAVPPMSLDGHIMPPPSRVHRSLERVAAIMSRRGIPMAISTVASIEQRALRKLAADPVMRRLVEEVGNQ